MLLSEIICHGRPRSFELGVAKSIVAVVNTLLSMPLKSILETLKSVTVVDGASEVMKVHADNVVLEVLNRTEERLLDFYLILLHTDGAPKMFGSAMDYNVFWTIEGDVSTRIVIIIFFASISDWAAEAATSCNGTPSVKRPWTGTIIVTVVVFLVHVAMIL